MFRLLSALRLLPDKTLCIKEVFRLNINHMSMVLRQCLARMNIWDLEKEGIKFAKVKTVIFENEGSSKGLDKFLIF